MLRHLPRSFGSVVLFLLFSAACLAGDRVRTGIEVLSGRGFDSLIGKNVGLITNHTGVGPDGTSDIDLLFRQKSFKLVALFSPEHGIRGTEDTGVGDSHDAETGLPIYSLYGNVLKPTPEMLRDIDVLVFDIQDIGTRFYTYIGTMAYAMQAARENGKKFVVLDRPNVIGGTQVAGAVPDEEICGGLTCVFPLPTRHGMTVGELALLFNDHFAIHADLEVVSMTGWRREMYYDGTGLPWINPSPNMKTLSGAIFYPGLGIAETTRLSVGRGTAAPFEVYGAPYVDPAKVLANLRRRRIPGVSFQAVTFTPTAKYSPFQGKLCRGVKVVLTDRAQFDPIVTGLHLVQAFAESFSAQFTADAGFAVMVGDRQAWPLLVQKREPPARLVSRWQPTLDAFRRIRARYLLYP